MFDYSTLVNEVRRLINDLPDTHIDHKEETTKDSYYVVLTEDGYATPEPSGVILNGVPIDDSGYTVSKNLIKFDSLISSGTEVLVHYETVNYTDDVIIEYIGDTIRNLVQPLFNVDFEFDDDGTTTDQTISVNMRSLFVVGTAMQIMGVVVTEASGDAIYIKDGDTIIDTASSSREALKAYQPILDRWSDLVKTIKINEFEGVVQY